MSEKETKKETASNKQDTKEKVVTKYDLKVQRREEAKAKAKRDRLVGNITGIVVVAALFCLVASFPIRSYLAVNETIAKVGGDKISRVEFDYNYNISLNDYLNQYGAYMSMFGMDLSGDLSTQMFSEELTFEDFFTQMAIENITNNKALLAEAQAAGFTYDTEADYADFQQRLKDAASEAGMTVRDFVRTNYGTFATLPRISDYVKEALYLSAYYDSVMDSKMPSDQEAENYYNENRDDFDAVDYRLLTVSAQLSEAPTEEETAKAMEEAKKEADAALKTVAAEGELSENMTNAYVPYLLRDWLFDSSRKAGDTTVIENTSAHSYYVVAFEDRYLDETPTVNMRTVITADGNAQAILEEWQGGAATEESFADICDKYNDLSLVSTPGGLMENVQPGSMPLEMEAWLSDSARSTGDATVISPEGDAYSYVLYYLGESDPWWMVSAKNTLLGTAMEAYMEEITADISVEDPKGNLKYLYVSEEDGDGEAGSDEAGSTDTGEDSGTSGSADAAGSSSAQ
ncbi:MAG: peptidylprolyl isomerase [Lachnospiraceae bacterium]|nr:peptidylprolyl isomerase [Lachnospiraceae bacterium]MCM1240425.1 peptidylprolyl isomerase [Lachnospiraceae bacterium]